MRNLPPSSLTGPTLVYKGTKVGGMGFYCSCCGMDFATTDPLKAFHGFSYHQCPSVRRPKPQRKVKAAS